MPIWKGAAKPISPGVFEAQAKRLGADSDVLRAIWQVESSGREFLGDGSLIRRFEPHHMPGASIHWRDSLKIPSRQREAMFLEAYDENPTAALKASSWGGSQIMGFNHKDAGFAKPEDMVRTMAASGDAQVQATIDLMLAWGLDAAIRAKDFLAIATRWNGSGQPEVYAAQMAKALKSGTGSGAPVVLRVGARGGAVKRLQAALGIPADGAFGPNTLAAVRAFQKREGLPVDGIVGARTWAALSAKTKVQPVEQPSSPWWAALIALLLKILSGGKGTS